MIYLTTLNQQSLCILEPGNWERIRAGEPLKTPDQAFLIAYSPDIVWTLDHLKGMIAACEGSVDPKVLDFILKEGLKRPEVRR